MPAGIKHPPKPKPSGQCEQCRYFMRNGTDRKQDYCTFTGGIVGSQWWSSQNCGVKHGD